MKTQKQYQIYKRIYIGKHRQNVWLDCCHSTYLKYSEECRRIKEMDDPPKNEQEIKVPTDEEIEIEFPYAQSYGNYCRQNGVENGLKIKIKDEIFF